MTFLFLESVCTKATYIHTCGFEKALGRQVDRYAFFK